jgi:DNA invertase Pin-like site-specific DNA recombinase
MIRAAQYVRMSTDHQQYSTANQSTANHAYAASREIEIVCTYADEGKSGLTFERRDALRQLITDVQNGRADFAAILVYDVSRWGRYQDADESAYYEYICKRAGINVHYCSEQFENDGSPFSAIVKAVKRTMAAEYSRELSAKVFAGKSRLIELGFRQGGPPGYGIRRMLVDQNGGAKGILARAERKSIATDRVILVPGPTNEIAIVRWIFSTFVHNRETETQIATSLNERRVPTYYGRSWYPRAVRQILRDEKYIGNNVWNRQSFKLQKVRTRNSPEMWLRADGVFQAIVDRSLFEAAQEIFRTRTRRYGPRRRYSDVELLRALRRLLRRCGYLSSHMIDKNGPQTAGAFRARFGTLKRAYHLAGFDADAYRKQRRMRPAGPSALSDAEMLAKLSALLRKRGQLTQILIEKTKSIPSPNAYAYRFGSLSEAYRLIGYAAKPGRRPAKATADDTKNCFPDNKAH